MDFYLIIRLRMILMETLVLLILSFLIPGECNQLDGYEFPVYSIESCPRNQSEWNKRSSAINCTKDNGYMCIPNDDRTQLLEFCYIYPRILITKETCLYMYTRFSRVNAYNCNRFRSGCPSSVYFSSEIVKYPNCFLIGNGCFRAEPTCTSSHTTTHLQETTKPKDVEFVTRNYSTTVSTDEKTNQTLKYNVHVIYDEIFMMPILAGVLIPIILFCMLCVIYRKEYHICKRKSDVESPGEEESIPHFPATDLRKMPMGTNKEGYHICERKSDVENPGDEDCKPLLQTTDPNQMPLGTNKEEYHICERKCDLESTGEKENTPLFPATGLSTMPMGTNKEESKINRAIFKQWQEDNDNFISTRACNEVEKLIKSQNLVVVTGNPGSGKSANIQHIALGYRDQGWTVIPVYSVIEIINAWSQQHALDKTLLVFNDPIGSESFDEEKYKLWKDHEERLKCCLKKIKMLVSCRRYILNDARVKGILKDTSCAWIIDLSDDQHKLDNEEKRKILEKYSSNSDLLTEDINEIIKTEEYFPLLCKLYFSDKNKRKEVLQFFKEPITLYKEQIRNFRKECKDSYCALVLLVLCNNQLCVEDIQNNDHLRYKFELALKLCDMTNSSPYTIGDILKTLQGFFVKKIGDTYHFYHDFIMEVTTYVFGTDYPLETIKYADIGFLRRRVTLKSSNDKRKEEVDKLTIYLNDRYVSDLGDRLLNEIFGDRMLDVVLNPCMRNEEVATFFIQKLKDSPEKLDQLLAKKQLHKMFRNQEDNPELKRSFGSKLEFLEFEDEVRVLSAIIVFCHTNVSKYCLKALKLRKTCLQHSGLFTTVCCNGSMDLFNVFPKEQIKTLLLETWGQYYPIHIVSLFHNHEILRELIQVKNEVNLSTYGYTPLMLAAINTDTSEQKNKESRIQSIDITVELLLNHGADIHSCHPLLGSPIHIASNEGNDYTVELLLEKGADINSCDKNIQTPLHKASEEGHKSTVQLLLEKGADINSCDTNNETPLHKCIEKAHVSTVQLLLYRGANINSCDNNKETPLHKASILGHESTVQLLLDQGANINSSDINRETPLHKASEWGRKSTVQLLLEKGANINSCNTKKETPLHKASKWGRESTVQLLLEKGADINLCDTKKETPLHKASKWGRESTVQLLLDKGADINSCNTNKETPLHKASEWGRESTVQLL